MVTAEIEQMFCSRRNIAGEDATRATQRWTITATAPAAEASSHGRDRETIGEIDVVVVDLVRSPDPWLALDSSNDDVAHIGDVVFDPNTGQLVEELESRVRGGTERVLILDRMELEPTWQGRGLAALLAGEALDHLRPGCQLTLCLPGPLHRPAGMSQEQYETGVARTRRVWEQLGFRPFREDVWMLDPNSARLQEALNGIRRLHGLAAG